VEHRCGTRYAVNVPAYLHTPDTSMSAFGWLREVSASGGFVNTRLELQPPLHVKVQLLTDRRTTSQPLLLDAHVIRTGPFGIYIQWTEHAPNLVRHLTEGARAQRAPRDTSPPLERAEPLLVRVSIDGSPEL